MRAATLALLMFLPADLQSQDAPADARRAVQEDREDQRRRSVTLAMAALSGIVLAGIVLIGGVLVWGNRLRRLNRKPLPGPSTDEAYWFLKPPKPPVRDRGPGEE